MKIEFTKMQGCGNDYVYVDGGKYEIPNEKKPEVVRFVSDRHFGIGSDGLIFINPVPENDVDFEMEMYNADGSRSEMCGNGIRCVAKFVYDKKLTDKKKLTIVSAGKKKYLDLNVNSENLVESVKVDMGAPILKPSEIPVAVDDTSCYCIDVPIEVGNRIWHMTCVSMGNPHAVVFLPENESLEDFDITHYGPLFENHPCFPKRVNTEFVKVDDRENVHMRVWERGTGETLACGTGCCATTVACILNQKTDNKVVVHVLGGEITCSFDGNPDSPVIMEGPATTVFEGENEV